jgi:hypothetical protein
MSGTEDFDLTNFDRIRRELAELQNAAAKDGTLLPEATASGRLPAPPRSLQDKERGKQLVSRMLTMLRRGKNDESPVVAGTNFTERGVGRLLRQLASPPQSVGSAQPVLQRLHQFLITPPRGETQMVAGASAEKIKALGRLLLDVEQHGWQQARSRLSTQMDRHAERPPEARNPREPRQPSAASATQTAGAVDVTSGQPAAARKRAAPAKRKPRAQGATA